MVRLEITGEVLRPVRLDFHEICELSGEIKDLATLISGRKGIGVHSRKALEFFVPETGVCHSGAVDACANVKYLGTLRLTNGPGRDTRPTNAAEHQDLHRRES